MKYILLAVVALCGLLNATDSPFIKNLSDSESQYFRGAGPSDTEPMWTYRHVEPSDMPAPEPRKTTSTAPNYMGVRVKTDPGKVEVQVATGPVKAFFSRLKEKREEKMKARRAKRSA